MNALEIKDLCKNYPAFSLDRLNLTLPSGCIMGLVGENGAGKSTTIRMILGMTKPDSGEITVFGESDFQAGQDGFMLRPVLGEVTAAGFAAIRPSRAEVAEVFTVPLRFFRETEPELYTYELVAKVPPEFPYEAVGISREYPWRGGRVQVPIWYYESHVIWGLTARVLLDITR